MEIITTGCRTAIRVPNLLMPQMPEVHLGKYAELRREYLMEAPRALHQPQDQRQADGASWQRSSRPRGRWWSRPWRRWREPRA